MGYAKDRNNRDLERPSRRSSREHNTVIALLFSDNND